MTCIDVDDAQAWCEPTKLQVTQLDARLVVQVETQVLGRLGAGFDTATWVSTTTTPQIIKSIISMFYVSWLYDRQYSEEQESGNDYAALLRSQAETLLIGVINGSIDVPGTPGTTSEGPSFYPTDESSLLCPTNLDSSLGPAAFTTGDRF
jgi:hypothetical protein